jgi:hypothetical protein
MITVPRTLKTKPRRVSNQENDIQWLIIDKYFLDLSRDELGLRVRELASKTLRHHRFVFSGLSVILERMA